MVPAVYPMQMTMVDLLILRMNLKWYLECDSKSNFILYPEIRFDNNIFSFEKLIAPLLRFDLLGFGGIDFLSFLTNAPLNQDGVT